MGGVLRRGAEKDRALRRRKGKGGVVKGEERESAVESARRLLDCTDRTFKLQSLKESGALDASFEGLLTTEAELRKELIPAPLAYSARRTHPQLGWAVPAYQNCRRLGYYDQA